MTTPHRPRLIHGDPETGGATTLFVVILAAVLFTLVGLIVDGGAMLTAYQKADSVARQAARTAGQQITLDPNRRPVVTAAGTTAGQTYMTSHGCQTATITATNDTITATCSLTYQPLFLPGTYTATRTATANTQNVTQP